VQSNWRIYVRDLRTGREGIFFTTIAMTNVPFALGARMLAAGMPMHIVRRGDVIHTPSGDLRVMLDPGDGSAPDAEMTLQPSATTEVASTWACPWAECWPDYRSFLAYCVPQDRAMSSKPLQKRISRLEIALDIPIDACQPLSGRVQSRAAHSIVGAAEPLCFYVPRAGLRFLYEACDPMDES